MKSVDVHCVVLSLLMQLGLLGVIVIALMAIPRPSLSSNLGKGSLSRSVRSVRSQRQVKTAGLFDWTNGLQSGNSGLKEPIIRMLRTEYTSNGPVLMYDMTAKGLSNRIKIWTAMNEVLSNNYIKFDGTKSNEETQVYFRHGNSIYEFADASMHTVQLMLQSYLTGLNEMHLNEFCYGEFNAGTFLMTVSMPTMETYGYPLHYPFNPVQYTKSNVERDIYNLGTTMWKFVNPNGNYPTQAANFWKQSIEIYSKDTSNRKERFEYLMALFCDLIEKMMLNEMTIEELLQHSYFKQNYTEFEQLVN